MRWDENYKNPEAINDPTVIPAYGVTDEERAYWNAKQEALKYDPVPTPYSDNHMISGALYKAFENYKVQSVEASKAFFWGVAGGLGQTKTACEAAQEAAELAQEAAEAAAEVSNTNRLASESSARSAAESKQIALARAGDATYAAEQSAGYATQSAGHANVSLGYSIDSEAWAMGTRNGVPVEPDDPAYHHNAKYFADLGREVIDDTLTSEYYTWSSLKLNNIFTIKADLVDGKVPAAQLPSYVDDVLEYASISEFPAVGESGKIYIATDTGKEYRWSGSGYAIISDSIALGETASTAYPGNKGKQNADNILAIQEKIPSAASASNKLATMADMPTDLADLNDDSTHRTVTDAEKTDWNSKAAGTHTHDDRYYTKSEVNGLFNGVTFTTVNNELYINW